MPKTKLGTEYYERFSTLNSKKDDATAESDLFSYLEKENITQHEAIITRPIFKHEGSGDYFLFNNMFAYVSWMMGEQYKLIDEPLTLHEVIFGEYRQRYKLDIDIEKSAFDAIPDSEFNEEALQKFTTYAEGGGSGGGGGDAGDDEDPNFTRIKIDEDGKVSRIEAVGVKLGGNLVRVFAFLEGILRRLEKIISFSSTFGFYYCNNPKVIDEHMVPLSKDWIILSSHGPEKYSFHITAKRLYVENCKEAKSITDKLINDLPGTFRDTIDSGVYKSIQNFRSLGMHKLGTKRIMKLDYDAMKALDQDLECITISNPNNKVKFPNGAYPTKLTRKNTQCSINSIIKMEAYLQLFAYTHISYMQMATSRTQHFDSKVNELLFYWNGLNVGRRTCMFAYATRFGKQWLDADEQQTLLALRNECKAAKKTFAETNAAIAEKSNEFEIRNPNYGIKYDAINIYDRYSRYHHYDNEEDTVPIFNESITLNDAKINPYIEFTEKCFIIGNAQYEEFEEQCVLEDVSKGVRGKYKNYGENASNFSDANFSNVQKEILNMLHDKGYFNHFSFRSMNYPYMNFSRTSRSHCNLCDRIHEKDNTLFVTLSAGDGWYDLYEHCMRKTDTTKKSIFIGTVGIKPLNMIKRLPNIKSNASSMSAASSTSTPNEPTDTPSATLKRTARENLERIIQNPIAPTSACLTLANRTLYNEPQMRDYEVCPTLIVQAQMKMGKTKAMLKFLADNFGPNDIIRIISFRRTFSDALASSYDDFTLYSDIKGSIDDSCKKLIIQVESLHRLEINDDVDLVILDESESILEQFNSPHHRDIGSSFSIFEKLIGSAKHVVCMDANIQDRTYNVIKSLRPNRPIRFHHNEFKRASTDKYSFAPTQKIWLDRLFDALKNEKRIVVPVNTRKVADALHKMIYALFPHLNIMNYTSQTSETTKIQHFSDVKNYWSQFDVLIYTPTLTAGVSYEEKHYDMIFAYFLDISCCVEVCRQMLGRVRSVTEYCLFVNNTGYKGLPTTLNELTDAVYARRAAAFGQTINGLGCDPVMIKKLGLEMFFETNYAKLWYENVRAANISYNDFTRRMIHQIMHSGASVSILDDTLITGVDYTKYMRGIIEDQSIEAAEHVVSAPTIGKDASTKLLEKSKSEELTPEELNSQKKFYLRNHYGVSPDNMSKEANATVESFITPKFVIEYSDPKVKNAFINIKDIAKEPTIDESIKGMQEHEQFQIGKVAVSSHLLPNDMINQAKIYKSHIHTFTNDILGKFKLSIDGGFTACSADFITGLLDVADNIDWYNTMITRIGAFESGTRIQRATPEAVKTLASLIKRGLKERMVAVQPTTSALPSPSSTPFTLPSSSSSSTPSLSSSTPSTLPSSTLPSSSSTPSTLSSSSSFPPLSSSIPIGIAYHISPDVEYTIDLDSAITDLSRLVLRSINTLIGGIYGLNIKHKTMTFDKRKEDVIVLTKSKVGKLLDGSIPFINPGCDLEKRKPDTGMLNLQNCVHNQDITYTHT